MSYHIIPTGDNSFTIYIPELDETYHSRKGAIAESTHVYIQSGLEYISDKKKAVRIFEFGFGTGLNALLTWKYAEESELIVYYDSVEKFPLEKEVYSLLNYDAELNTPGKLTSLHEIPWNETFILSDHFTFQKHDLDIRDFAFPSEFYDLIYFDAFAPSKQAEVWSIDILEKIYESLSIGGVLVTYCSQGEFRRNLKTAGFTTEKIPGPPGKREMIRAIKQISPVIH